MPASVPVLATASILTALAFLEAVAYLDDGTTLCGLLYSRLTASTDC